MKTYILSALLVLGVTVTSTQAIATGLTYDPYENYYSQFYGIDQQQTIAPKDAVKTSEDDPKDVSNRISQDADLMDSMADPSNYYSW